MATSSDQLRQQLMSQLLMGGGPTNTIGEGIASLGRSIGGVIGGNRAISDARAQEEQMRRLLMGTPSTQPALPGATAGGIQGFTPSRPGLASQAGIDPALAGVLMQMDPGGGLLAQQSAQRLMPPEPGEGFSLSPGEVRYDAQGRLIAAAPGAVEPPKTRDVLKGNERVFEQFDPATGQWAEVGRGPAFAPSASTVVNVGGNKPPANYEWVDPNDPEQGVRPIKGGPAEEFTGTAAAGATLGPGALADVSVLQERLINSDGTLDRETVAMMNAPIIGAIPGTEGVDLRARMEGGIEAILRPISGATIQESERSARRAMYMPSITDSDAVARNKLARYQRDLAASLATSTRGRGDLPAPAETPAAAGSEGVSGLLDQGMDWLGGLTGQAASTPTPTAPQASEEGLTATNPETGERVIFRNGQWVPL